MPSRTVANRRSVRFPSWIQMFLGVLVFLAPLLATPVEFRWWHWNAWTVGVLVFGLGLVTAVSPHERTQGALAGGSLQLLSGLWLVVAAVLSTPDTVFFVLTVVLGSAIVAVAAYHTRVGAVEAGRKAT